MLPFLESGYKDGVFKKNFLLYYQDLSKHAKTDHLSKTCFGYLYWLREPRSMAFPEPVNANINWLVFGGVGKSLVISVFGQAYHT